MKSNVLIVLGLLIGVGSFYMGQKGAQQQEKSKASSAKHAEDHDHEEGDHGIVFTAELKKNLNVTVGAIEKKTYTKYLDIPVTPTYNPMFEYMETAKTNALVKSVSVNKGAFVTTDTVLAVLQQSEKELPDYSSVQDFFENRNMELLLRGIQKTDEKIFDQLSAYIGLLKLTRTELQALAKKPFVELKATIFLKVAEALHLLDAKELRQCASLLQKSGRVIPELVPLLIVIKQKGLWSEFHQKNLSTTVKNSWEVIQYFDLILGKHSESYITDYMASGYLSSEIIIKAKADGFVSEWNVMAGQPVAVGDVLYQLSSQNHLVVGLKPRGLELKSVKNAIDKQYAFILKSIASDTVVPVEYIGISAGEVPEFQFRTLVSQTEKKSHAVTVIPGEHCLLRVPLELIKDALLLPKTAIAVDGFKTFLYLENGDSFEKEEVAVLLTDKEVVVIDETAAIGEGDIVVTSGANQLYILEKSSEAPVADEHGHSH